VKLNLYFRTVEPKRSSSCYCVEWHRQKWNKTSTVSTTPPSRRLGENARSSLPLPPLYHPPSSSPIEASASEAIWQPMNGEARPRLGRLKPLVWHTSRGSEGRVLLGGCRRWDTNPQKVVTDPWPVHHDPVLAIGGISPCRRWHLWFGRVGRIWAM
jgi:hypothetical protein